MSNSSIDTYDLREESPRFELFRTDQVEDPLRGPAAPVRLEPIYGDDRQLGRFLSDPLTACRWSLNGGTAQLSDRTLVIDTESGEPVSALALTDVELRNGHARILVAAIADDESLRRAMQGMFDYVDRVFAAYPFAKLYFELLDDEFTEVESALGRFMTHEATFRGHLYWNGQRLDVHTVAIDRQRWEQHRADDSLHRVLELAAAPDGTAPHRRATRLVSDLSMLRGHRSLTSGHSPSEVPGQMELERDLGLDSLALAELDLALRRFAAPGTPPRRLRTIADVLLGVTAPGAAPLFSPC